MTPFYQRLASCCLVVLLGAMALIQFNATEALSMELESDVLALISLVLGHGLSYALATLALFTFVQEFLPRKKEP